MRTILGQVVYPSMIQARPIIEIQLKEDISQYIIPSKLILTNKTKKSPNVVNLRSYKPIEIY